jgi:predicted RNA binding protein YcfA (HicA-like mRNA interferase family)
MSSNEVIRRLRAGGWTLVRVKGSHHVFGHPGCPRRIVVPHPRKDLGAGLVAAILGQAGLRR